MVGLIRGAIACLTVASLAFYSYWNPPFVLLILFSIVFNFVWGSFLTRAGARKRWRLFIGVAVNLSLIGYFKYTGFFIENANALFSLSSKVPDIFLPLGISFFTFQQIAYLVDCHRGITREHSFLQYCLFVTFFPQLIAGPIVHHGEMMTQFSDERTFRYNPENMATGFAIFSMGLFKKVIIADTLSPWVADIFDGNGEPAMLVASWIGSLAYTFQIYFDFSGYSDMALGLGHFFNIKIPVNFDAPYKSRNMVEFWQRWHMTLSRFLREYLYIPLGGNRKGTPRRYVNLMAVMLIGGLWHGAAWTFVFWGGLHGLYLCINHGWGKISTRLGFRLPLVLAWALTFVATVFAWVFFRAATFGAATNIIKGMAGFNGVENMRATLLNSSNNELMPWFPGDERVVILIALLAMCVSMPVGWRWARERLKRLTVPGAIFAGLLFSSSVLGLTRISEFLYFQF